MDDLSYVAKLGVCEREFADASVKVGRVQRQGVEARRMRNRLVMSRVLAITRDLGMLGFLETLELALESDYLFLKTAEEVSLLVHFNIKII